MCSQNIVLDPFHLYLVPDAIIKHSRDFKVEDFLCHVARNLFLSIGLYGVIKLDDLFGCVKPLELFSELQELFFQCLYKRVECVLYPFFIPAELLFPSSLSFVDFMYKLFVVHKFAFLGMVPFALKTHKTVLYYATFSYT